MASSASSYSYSNYDVLGRPGAAAQTTNGQTYSFPSVTWTPQGQVSSITYPSGRVITTTFDGAGRPSGVSGGLNSVTTPYASGITYAAHGGLAGLTTGDGLSRAIGYNGRLQMSSVQAPAGTGSLLALGFGYSATGNNGNLLSQSITRPGLGTVTQNYGYDGVNRLTTASEGANWNQTYVYDNVGNRAVLNSSNILVSDDTPQTGSTASAPFTNRNHWTLADPAGYDGAGNMIAGNSASITQKALGHDAESRMTSWQATTNSVTTQVTFTYGGDGRRVTKTTPAGTTVYVYDPAGNLAAEYGGAAAVSGTVYLTQDQLGSTRLVTNGANGQPQVVGCHDYLPFGEEIPAAWGRSAAPCYGQTGDTSIQFTGQERDSETGLDNFLARHMAGAQGRFVSPDPANAGADAADPQSWNAYSYVRNAPMGYVDPNGLDPVYIDIASDANCTYFTSWYETEGHGSYSTVDSLCTNNPTFSTTVVSTAPPLQPPPSQPTPKDTGQQCLKGYYNSTGGKILDMLSISGLIPGWGPNASENRRELETVTLAKAGGLQTLRSVANKMETQEILSITGPTSTAIGTAGRSVGTTVIPSSAGAGLGTLMKFLGRIGPVVWGVATAGDITAHATCYYEGNPDAAAGALRALQ